MTKKYLQKHKRRESQLRANDMVGHKQLLKSLLILDLKPLLKALGTMGLNEPDPTVIALDVGPARLGPTEPTTGGVEVVEPSEHGLLYVHDG